MGPLAVLALVYSGVGVAQLDGDAPLQLLAVAGGPDTGQRLDKGGLAMVDVADGADVDLRLAR
jgi:hypothetical protein